VDYGGDGGESQGRGGPPVPFRHGSAHIRYQVAAAGFSIRRQSTSEVAMRPVSIISSTSGIKRSRFSAVSTMVTTIGWSLRIA